MKLGKPQGIAIMTLGLLLLSGAIVVLVYVPSWGNWLKDYPAQAAARTVPPEAAAVKQAVLQGVMGPLIYQVGGYVQSAGYFIGSLLTIVSLAVTSVGTKVLKNAKS